ncbi:hypothetical protein FB45DRAFT_1078789 [Roridomyces roridus]|uniref:Uncharacterized protein n=1 Tax=Roridomyces roridus TaxID=1738132 RepID=A0AAD7CKV6_9AGAR|nr:hypothetical protein FB45DRAFT_1078789 [Roridomyces roridus]
MPPHLPDEIILEILSPVLHVSDELFSDTSHTSPFSNNIQSSSPYLLVCKQWLRVATPLLYGVVPLRSTAQATALAATLKAVPELGRFIKKLRVEGGYGACMHTILKSSPNIRDLCLSFAIWSSDNTSGLCKGLPLIDPRRLIIVDHLDVRNNKHLDALEETRTLGYPYGLSVSGHNSWMQRALDLSEVLPESQVHTIVLSGDFCRRSDIPTFIVALCNIPALRLLQFKRPFWRWSSDHLLAQIDLNPRLKLLAQYTVEETATGPEITLSSNPHFIPMQFASERTREIVWKRVIFFALSMEKLRSPSVCWEQYPSPLPITTVSKYFHRLALPYLYECIPLTRDNSGKFSRALQARPYLGSFIRRVFTFEGYRNLPLDDDAINAILDISQHAHNLVVFAPHLSRGLCANSLPIEALVLLATNSGHSLQHLSLETQSQGSISASLLECFTALRVLEWRSWIEVTGVLWHPDSFKSLHTLHIHSGGTMICRLLTDARLPRLCILKLTLWISETNKPALVEFLRLHGPKVLRLTILPRSAPSENIPVLDFCPNLSEVEIMEISTIFEFQVANDKPLNVFQSCNLGALISNAPHRSLTKIVAKYLPERKDMASEMSFNPEMFPVLREIQINSLGWPITVREISKSLVVPMAEALLRYNIKITNGEGRSWTPRLKTARAATRVIDGVEDKRQLTGAVQWAFQCRS